MKRACVAGAGIAALCAARALLANDWTVRLSGRRPSRSPTLVLNGVTIDLVRRLFGDGPLVGAHWLAGRVVRWESGAPAADVGEPAAVLEESRLCGGLLAALRASPAERLVIDDEMPEDDDGTWLLRAGGRQAPGPARRHRFGNRAMIVTRGALHGDPTIAHIETTPAGWLFLAPTSGGEAMLQAMVARLWPRPTDQVAAMLASAPDIDARFDGTLTDVTVFDAAPALAEPLGGDHWLGVGDQAVSFDPLCGDGVGFAVRGAILAAAVVEAIVSGLPATDALEHYEARLETVVAHHLRACERFYGGTSLDASWDSERQAIVASLAFMAARRQNRPGLRFGIRGFSLVPLSAIPTPQQSGEPGGTGSPEKMKRFRENRLTGHPGRW